LNQYSKAIEDYRKALEINPKNIANLKNLAELLLIIGNFSYAVDIITSLMEIDSKDDKLLN
jgi:tetratricopeptide (TPR) repeat protein